MRCFGSWATPTIISKASEHRKDGLSPSVKMGVQIFLALGVAAYLYRWIRRTAFLCDLRRESPFYPKELAFIA